MLRSFYVYAASLHYEELINHLSIRLITTRRPRRSLGIDNPVHVCGRLTRFVYGSSFAVLLRLTMSSLCSVCTVGSRHSMSQWHSRSPVVRTIGMWQVYHSICIWGGSFFYVVAIVQSLYRRTVFCCCGDRVGVVVGIDLPLIDWLYVNHHFKFTSHK